MSNKMIIITMRPDTVETVAMWGEDEWDDYCYDGKCFIVIKNNARVGFYNLDCVKTIVIK